MPLPPGEAIAAVIGFADLLRKEPKRVTAGDVEAALAIPRRVRQACREYLEHDGFRGRAPALDRVEYQPALKMLHTPDDAHHVEAVHEAFRDRHELADAYLVVAGRAVGHLLPLLPTRSEQTMTELRPIEPSRQEYARFLRAWTAVNNPLVLLDQLNAGAVSSDAVDAVAAVFPALYGTFQPEVRQALFARKLRNSSYIIPSAKDRELCRLLQIPIVPGALAKELQGAFEKAAADKPGPGADVTKPSQTAQSYQTPTTRAEEK